MYSIFAHSGCTDGTQPRQHQRLQINSLAQTRFWRFALEILNRKPRAYRVLSTSYRCQYVTFDHIRYRYHIFRDLV